MLPYKERSPVEFLSMHWKALLALAILLLFGGALRFGALSGTVVDSPIRADANDYFMYGYNMRAHGVYSRDTAGYHGSNPIPDAIRAPAYGAFIAAFMDFPAAGSGVMKTVVASIQPVLAAQTVLSLLTVVIVFAIALRFMPLWAATLAGFLTAASPHLVNANVYLLSETLFTFWFCLSVFFLLGKPSITRYAVAGVCLAAATLTRPITAYLPLLFVFVMAGFVERRHWRPWLAFFIASGVVTLLWSLRNLSAIGAMSDPHLLTGIIHDGIYPGLMFNDNPASLGIPYRFDPSLSADESKQTVTAVLTVLAERFQEHPGKYLYWYLIDKPLTLFNWHILPIGTSDVRMLVAGDIYLYPTLKTPYASSPLFILSYVAVWVCYIPTLMLAGATSISAWLPQAHWTPDQQRPLRLAALMLTYVIAISIIGAPYPRYAIPFLPLLYLLAAGLLATLWQRWQTVRERVEAKRQVL
jgi:hypothetical protein